MKNFYTLALSLLSTMLLGGGLAVAQDFPDPLPPNPEGYSIDCKDRMPMDWSGAETVTAVYPEDKVPTRLRWEWSPMSNMSVASGTTVETNPIKFTCYTPGDMIIKVTLFYEGLDDVVLYKKCEIYDPDEDKRPRDLRVEGNMTPFVGQTCTYKLHFVNPANLPVEDHSFSFGVTTGNARPERDLTNFTATVKFLTVGEDDGTAFVKCGGYSASVNFEYVVNPAPPTPVITSITPKEGVQGKEVEFAVTIAECEDPITKYKWEFTGANIASSEDEKPKVTFAEAGEHTVKCTVGTEKIDSETFTVTFRAMTEDEYNTPTDLKIVTPESIKGGVAVPLKATVVTRFPITKWEWTIEGADPASSTEAEPSVVWVKVGTYTIKVKATNEKEKSAETSKQITISELVSAEALAKDAFSVYPVPADKYLHVVMPEGNYHVALYSLDGACVIREDVCGVVRLDVADLASGAYLLVVEESGKSLSSHRVEILH